jgi:hypothetical protein
MPKSTTSLPVDIIPAETADLSIELEILVSHAMAIFPGLKLPIVLPRLRAISAVNSEFAIPLTPLVPKSSPAPPALMLIIQDECSKSFLLR